MPAILPIILSSADELVTFLTIRFFPRTATALATEGTKDTKNGAMLLRQRRGLKAEQRLALSHVEGTQR